MVLPLFFPATLVLPLAGPEGAKNLAGICPPPDSDSFNRVQSGENYAGWSRQFAAAQTTESQFDKRNSVPFCMLVAHIKPQCERPKQAPQRTASFANRRVEMPHNTAQVDKAEQQHAVPCVHDHVTPKRLLGCACFSSPHGNDKVILRDQILSRTRKSPFPVPETPSAFRRHAPRSAFRHCGARQQSRLFAPRNQWLRPSPSSNRLS